MVVCYRSHVQRPYHTFSFSKRKDLVINRPHLQVLFQWSDTTNIKINSGKNHILFSGNALVSTNINNSTIKSDNKNKLLGTVLDSKLCFWDHKNNLCKTTNRKHSPLARIPYVSGEKKNSCESICNIPFWILSFILDVS